MQGKPEFFFKEFMHSVDPQSVFHFLSALERQEGFEMLLDVIDSNDDVYPLVVESLRKVLVGGPLVGGVPDSESLAGFRDRLTSARKGSMSEKVIELVRSIEGRDAGGDETRQSGAEGD
jgi:hypothetical protein